MDQFLFRGTWRKSRVCDHLRKDHEKDPWINVVGVSRKACCLREGSSSIEERCHRSVSAGLPANAVMLHGKHTHQVRDCEHLPAAPRDKLTDTDLNCPPIKLLRLQKS